AQLRVPSGCAVTLLDLLGGGESLIGVPALQQPLGDIGVEVHPFRLPVRLVRTAHADAFVPVQAEPGQGIEELLVALLTVPCGVPVGEGQKRTRTFEVAAEVMMAPGYWGARRPAASAPASPAAWPPARPAASATRPRPPARPAAATELLVPLSGAAPGCSVH